MKANVTVIGEGILADYVYNKLSERYQLFRLPNFSTGVPLTSEFALVLSDHWDASLHLRAEKEFQVEGMAWLRGFIASPDEGIVGPLVQPRIPGCSVCADYRYRVASSKFIHHQEESINDISYRHIAHLIVAETDRFLQGGKPYTEDHLYVIKLSTLRCKLHYYVPDPHCPQCGDLPDDSPLEAQIKLEPKKKTHVGSYRTRSLESFEPLLSEHYLDSRLGIFNSTMVDLVSPFSAVTVNLPLFMGSSELTGGRSHSYKMSELTALLEGLERYCGQYPRGRRTVVHESYRHVSEYALDPTQIGLYSNDQYELPGFPFEAYDPDRNMQWVWGYSFLQERAILVPECIAYYSSNYGNSFVQEGSNGCAIGGSLEEAIVHGILEVVERDSFLMTWYAKLPVPQLDPYSANNMELQFMITKLQAATCYHIHLFNITMENGIPSIWAMAKSQEQDSCNLLCTAAAHLDPIQAAISAVHELASKISDLNDQYRTNLEEIRRMFDNPDLVQQLEHHSLLYCLPEAEERLHFLFDQQRPLRTFEEEFKPFIEHIDITDDLTYMIQIFRQLKLDIIVVDQSSPEIIQNGLHCVKVLIPGMLPMTFGHQLARVTQLCRVLLIPAMLGYSQHPLTVEQLNKHPHPFL